MIPKIIHHIWPSDTQAFSDPRMIRWRGTWLRYHPDWTFMFWRLDNLPLEKFSENGRLVVTGSDYTVLIKSNIIRWELLSIFGGFYVDTDTECLRSIEDYRKEKALLVYMKSGSIWDCILGFPPDDLLCKSCGDAISEHVIKNPKHSLQFGVISPLILASGYPIQETELCWTITPEIKKSRPGGELIVHHRSGLWPEGWQRVDRYNEQYV